MNAPANRTILVMAGGTGGHVFPALAVAQRLRASNYHIVWLGTRQGIEARLVPAAGIEIEWLPVGGLRGKGVATLLLAPVRLLRAGFAALQVFNRVRPVVVLGMGGFASGPGGVIAWLKRVPLVVHEQNAIAGVTNRILAHLARRVLVAFPGTLSPKEEVVGNPVREDVIALADPALRFADREGALRVLVLGGSLGARALNEIVPAALRESGIAVEVRHQCGRGDADSIREAYAKLELNAVVQPFFDDMADAYGWADIAICRAGAMTVYELAAAGLGAVLVPFPYAVDDHQTANAHYLADKNAAVILQEREMTTARLAGVLRGLGNRGELQGMATNARSLSRPAATGNVADVCAQLAAGGAA